MRNSFIRAMEEYATPDTLLVLGDLGFGVVNGFREKYPEQCINAGVAEQNMTGMSAGLALAGKKVFTYSIANFNTLRPLEFIRNDVAYHDLNVIVVSVGGGLAYGSLGISHHATEDLAILRSIPNLKVLAPGDTEEAFVITRKLLQENLGSVYLRLGRAGEATLHNEQTIRTLEIGKVLPLWISDRKDVALLSTGGMLETASQVRGMLEKNGLGASVYSYHTIKPFDKDKTREIFKTYKYVFTMEEHSVIGGLNSSVLESLAGEDVNLSGFHPFALPAQFTYKVGDQNYLRDQYGISPNKVMKKIMSIIQERN